MTYIKYVFLIFLALCSQDAFAKRMTFNSSGNGGNCNECEFVVADGDIALDSIDDFREAGGRRVYLNSTGGSLEGALALGEEFRKIGAIVIVGAARQKMGSSFFDEGQPGKCLSACVFALFGGIQREVIAGSTIGIHAFDTNANNSADVTEPIFSKLQLTAVQRLTGILLEYTQRMGVDPLIIDWAAKQDNSGMRTLTPEELRHLRVVWDSDTAGQFRIELYKSSIIARSELPDSSYKATLLCVKNKIKLVISLKDVKKYNALEANIKERSEMSIDEQFNYSFHIFPYSSDSDIFSQELLYKYKSTMDENGIYRTINIEESDLYRMSEERMLAISFGELRGDWQAITMNIPTDGLSDIFRLLKHNCL